MIQEIKWAYQRVVRGYDDRIYWAFDDYFIQFIPPLKEFCEEELKEEYMDSNPELVRVYNKTLKLIEGLENMEELDFVEKSEKILTFWRYFGNHIGCYWN